MRVAVTGASGFIGSALVPALRALGNDVRAVARDSLDLPSAFAGVDAVVHLANLAHGRSDASRLRLVNVEGTRSVARLAADAGLRRFVYLSSVKAVAEESSRPLDESEPPAPRDAYGHAKLAAERSLAEIASSSNLEIVVLRPPLVYGPGVKANFFALMRMIAGGLPLPFASIRNQRSLVYVGNLCEAIGACVFAPGAAGRTFFVSDGSSVSTPELCRGLARALGKPARLFPFPPALLPVPRLTQSLVVDDAAIRGALRWQPPFTFEQGLRATADWYLRR
ncbi:MAG TPA: NAD-dependent epimerase/dehydratase family protein [Burkholderiales bacterium]|nr:NAD-dependent epimerase/dehydratase family protein [Burkholderiales bacterium]